MAKWLDIIRSLIPTFENLPALSSVTVLGPGWLFGIFGTVALSLYGLSLGRTRVVLSLLSLYVALAVVHLFPYLNGISRILDTTLEDYWLSIGVFAAVYIMIFLIFNFSFIRKRLSSSEFSLFGVMLISILQFGFLASIIFSFLPHGVAVKWSSGFYAYFATKQALFMWAIAPLPVLMFIKKK